ncbi:hydroxymethylpyrimidine pyrophosphatase-like HAD family hydrolase [Wenyingzhuangia heitensis]|uniref:Hydroxymethylpyrimidine pyrophosphatase-like HAD family hydrolase n=1 Tax=Wenyingzhuangia heitensis TaxID=1487859 RepID=A0ABX0U736_9FLAO|nr:hydrolase [Wenyingzhuangia heitensis]NIJ43790.1 hydroxymethylpyrimidine pyrophosphatase-like HAD family hydrolase [Wenyingzhuangia heitensis]
MSIPNHQTIIAVDFDGTIVKDEYPKIGPAQLFAFSTLKKMQEKGYRLILWTLRDGRKLDEAVAYCKENGVEFYAVNKNYPEETLNNKSIRKIHADLFIDDRNIGGFIGWGKIHQLLFDDNAIEEPKKKGFLGFFK